MKANRVTLRNSKKKRLSYIAGDGKKEGDTSTHIMEIHMKALGFQIVLLKRDV